MSVDIYHFIFHIYIAPAQFETCSGNNIPQVGCSREEKLSTEVGESVAFNIALTHQRTTNNNCFNQFIQMVTFFKSENANGALTELAACSNTICVTRDSRINVTRSVDEFGITIVLDNLSSRDSGSYVAVADIRAPTNNMRIEIFKNFSLTVNDIGIN